MSVPPAGKKLPTLAEIVDFLEQATNLRVISNWLHENDLPHTVSSWKQLLEERLQPAVDAGEISLADLMDHLSKVEEFSACHVFIYKCQPNTAAELLKRENIENAAKKLGIEHLLTDPALTTLPASPTISGIRFVEDATGASLSIKVVETRKYEERKEEIKRNGVRIVTYTPKKARAVNVVRLSSLGILEVRIRSHSSDDYDPDIKKTWHELLPDFFPVAEFKSHPLDKLKAALWEKRAAMTKLYRFSDAKMRDEFGCTIAAATPKRESDLSTISVAAVQSYLDDGAYQESSGMWWNQQKEGGPTTDIHVWLSGKTNEFTLRASNTKEDFEYVLAQFTRIGF
ncbi:MAG: hypothetical protein WCF18_02105 [Chthoniobacteraceae bacterium]